MSLFTSGVGMALGAGFGALGASKDNANIDAAATDLKRRERENRKLAKPVGLALRAGYAPGGFLSRSLYANNARPVLTQLGNTQTDLRSGAWRYGGSGSGLAQRRWLDAARAADMGLLDAQMKADTNAMDVLGRMQTLEQGYKDSFNPQSIQLGQYSWVPGAIGSGVTAYNQASADQGQARRSF